MAALEKLSLALVGHGKMGKLIEKHAQAQGHKVVAAFKSEKELLAFDGKVDAAIDFSTPAGISERVEFFLGRKIPLIIGTTGWEEKREEIVKETLKQKGSILYSPNFSIGIALFLQLVKSLAKLYDHSSGYSLSLLDEHHSQKKDAPSGTALKIIETIKQNSSKDDKIDIASLRYGFVPGNHTLTMDGPFDTLTISHSARSRDGFAIGAIDAAIWLIGKTGFFTLEDMIKEQHG